MLLGHRRGRLLLLGLPAAALLVAGACSDPYSGDETADSGPPDAAPDAELDAAPADPCTHAVPVSAPDKDDAPGEVLPNFVLALDTSVFQFRANSGLDLDGVCTCETKPGTAFDGGESCIRPKATEVQCDYPNGVDNALLKLFEAFAAFYPLQELPGEQIAKGRTNVLLQIANYNGKANDKDVSVGVLQSDGIRTQGCPGSINDPGKGVWTPGWCGDDAWSVTPESVVGNDQAPAIVGRGYVKDYQLFVRINGTPRMPFSDEHMIAVADPTFTGKLVPLGEDLKPRDPARVPTGRELRLWRIDNGELTGRIAVTELLISIGSVRFGTDAGNVQVCTQGVYASTKSILCSSPDLAATRALDFDPSAPCDSLSAGVPIGAMPALIGEISTRGRPKGACDPGPDGQPVDASVTYTCP